MSEITGFSLPRIETGYVGSIPTFRAQERKEM